MKWEFIKRYKDLRIYYFIMGAVTVLCLAMPTDIRNYSGFVAIASSLFGGIFSVMVSIYLMVAIASDLRKPTAILEKSICKKVWEIIGGKLMINLTWMLFTFAFVKLLSVIINRFSTEQISYLSINIRLDTVFLMGIFLPLIILFFYLLAKRIPFTREITIAATVTFLIAASMLVTNILSILGLNKESADNQTFLMIAAILFSVLLFFGSCSLYKHSYDRY
jgi:hypothetical protein